MKEKILKYGKSLGKEQLFADIFGFVFGFIVSFAKISGVMTPFCLSFAMAFKKRLSIFCFLGSIFEITLFLNSENIIYLFILFLGLVCKILFKFDSSLKNAFFCAVCFILPYTISIIFMPISFGTLLLIYSKMVFCAAITALCTYSLKNFSFEFKDKVYDFLVFIIFFIVVLISFCNFNFAHFNFGRFVSAFFIIQIFLYYDYSLACVFGLVITIAFALYTKDFAKFGVVLAISAFLGGFFKKAGRFFQMTTFLFTYFFCCMFFGGFHIFSLIEIVLACFLALVFPKKIFAGVFSKDESDTFENKFEINDKISSKLKFAANMLLDLQENIKKYAKIMDISSCKDLNNLYEKLCDSTCKDCGLNTFCWVTAYGDLSCAFSDTSVVLRKNGSVDEATIPIFFSRKCCRLKSLIQNINFLYKEYICFELNKRRVNEVRDIATEQFSGISEFLIEMSDEIKSVKKIDYLNTKKILQILEKNEIKVKNLFCFLDEFDRVSIDLYLYSILEKEMLRNIKKEVCALLEKKFCYSSFTKAGDCYKISFFEETEFSIQFAAEQVAVSGNKYCGDSYQYFIDEKGFAHIILSDGMGNGKRAALDSLMTCSTLRKFIESGFGFKSAIKLLNLSFAIKSREESLATVDSFTIDLYTGESKFIKAGATCSYVSTKEKILRFNSKSLPIGIIQGISVDTEKFVLCRGDVVVMVSDGATSYDLDWIGKVLKEISKEDPNYIAKYILNYAKKIEDKEHLDDITVIVFKII